MAPALAYPMPLRRVLYTTNAIESLPTQIHKIIKTRAHCPTDDAASKLLYLALRNIGKNGRTNQQILARGRSASHGLLRRSAARQPMANSPIHTQNS
jgi:transposase-like protein